MQRVTQPGKRLLKRAVWALTGIVLAVLFISVVLTSVLLLPSRPAEHGTPTDLGLAYEDLTIQSNPDCVLSAWFIPNPNSHGQTLLLLHGIAANKAELLKQARIYHDLGYNVVLLDQRHQGDSTGPIATYGWLERRDVDRVLTVVEQRPDVSHDGAVVVGFSMGAAIALQTLPDPHVRAVVADSAFADLPSMLRVRSQQWHIPSWPFIPLCSLEVSLVGNFQVDDVSPLTCVAHTDKPVLLIHGGRDHSIPVKQAQELAAAGGPSVQFWLVPEAGHVGAADSRPQEYYARVGAFLQQVFEGKTASLPRD